MKTFEKIYWSSLGTMVLTMIHHAYGALIYEAPFRLHVVFYAVPVLVLLLLAYRTWCRQPESPLARVAYWAFIILTLLAPIGSIGFIEGGYNHLLKNLLYFGGIRQSRLHQLFPPPTYEMPNNLWFEASGILQFLTGAYCLYYLIRWWKTKGLTTMTKARIQRA